MGALQSLVWKYIAFEINQYGTVNPKKAGPCNWFLLESTSKQLNQASRVIVRPLMQFPRNISRQASLGRATWVSMASSRSSIILKQVYNRAIDGNGLKFWQHKASLCNYPLLSTSSSQKT